MTYTYGGKFWSTVIRAVCKETAFRKAKRQMPNVTVHKVEEA